MENKLNNIIESVVKKVILEYGGVSDEIINISNIIFNKIYREHRNHSRRTYFTQDDFNGHKLYGKKFYLDINDSEEIMNVVQEVAVQLYYYDTINEDYASLFEFLNSHRMISNYFSPSDRMIRLTFPWPNDDRFDANSRTTILSTINHEVKHAFQDSREGGHFISSQYIKADKEQDREIGYNKEADTPSKVLVDYYIPWIYYRLHRREIDAWLQEMYIQGIENSDIKETKIYKMLAETIKDYNNLKRWYSSNDKYYTNQKIKDYIDNSIKRIDSPKSYFAMCDRNIGYLKKKMRRVIGRWYEEKGITNGSFKQYSSNEISQSLPFNTQKKNRNRWKNMLRKFFS